MSIILFFIVLAVLVLSHEFGHFITAKKAGIKVDEFGFGFPPKIFGFRKGETLYSFNAIPFGGFVKIEGENGGSNDNPRSFAAKSVGTRSLIIAAGVIFNVILAWFLITGGFLLGMPSSVSGAPSGAEIKDKKVIILQVIPDSPADKAGLKPGDQILGFDSTDEVKNFIDANKGREIEIKYFRPDDGGSAKIIPRINPPEGEGAVGIAMDEVGLVKLSPYKSVIEGAKMTFNLTVGTAVSIFYFIAGAIKGTAGLSLITGPVGIVGIVGGAAKFGFTYFLSLVAFLSINLAIINILPFPALDGGRLLFLLIEKLKSSPVNPKFAAVANSVGMAVLLAFMLLITYKDIVKLF